MAHSTPQMIWKSPYKQTVVLQFCNTSRTVPGHTYKSVTTKATLTKNGKINYKCTTCGYIASTSKTIYRANSFKLSATAYAYNGRVRTPTVTVKNAKGTKLTKGTHYTISYASGRKNVGTYKVTIKMKGNYSGTKVLTFKIIPRAASINSLTARTKAMTVKLNRSLKQSTGYQIQYSANMNFKSAKTITLTNYQISTKTISGLNAKTTYFVRVRTYKTVSGVKYYSNWSAYQYKRTK